MVSIEAVRKLALSFSGVEEQDHWERPAFRTKKRIFATLRPAEQRVIVKLSPEDQSVFCNYNSAIFYPVNNAWGKQGWTTIELKKVRKDMLTDALALAWQLAMPVATTKKAAVKRKRKS